MADPTRGILELRQTGRRFHAGFGIDSRGRIVGRGIAVPWREKGVGIGGPLERTKAGREKAT